MQVHYCEKCNSRLTPEEVEEGKSLSAAGGCYCLKCAAEIKAAGGSGKQQGISSNAANAAGMGSGLRAGAKPSNSGLHNTAGSSGSGLRAAANPSGSGLRAAAKPSGSGLRAAAKPSGSGLRAAAKPSGSGLRAGVKPAGSGAQAQPGAAAAVQPQARGPAGGLRTPPVPPTAVACKRPTGSGLRPAIPHASGEHRARRTTPGANAAGGNVSPQPAGAKRGTPATGHTRPFASKSSAGLRTVRGREAQAAGKRGDHLPWLIIGLLGAFLLIMFLVVMAGRQRNAPAEKSHPPPKTVEGKSSSAASRTVERRIFRPYSA